jgi:transcriptional regulator with GAF, ATPase, and Fis domain
MLRYPWPGNVRELENHRASMRPGNGRGHRRRRPSGRSPSSPYVGDRV